MSIFHHASQCELELTELELLHLILKEQRQMALDLSKLQPAVDASIAATEALIAAHTDPAAQGAVDAAVTVLAAETAKATAALAPVTPAA